MKPHLIPAICLSLLVAGCEKPQETTQSEEKTVAPRPTKSSRPVSEELQGVRNRMKTAIKKASEIATPEERNQAIAAAIWEAADTDPEQARQDLQKLTPGSEEKNKLIAHLAMRLAEQDVDDAVRWASSLDSEEEKSLALGKVALVISNTDPARAAQLLSDTGVASRDFDVSVVQVVQRWAGQSPADAAEWVASFNPGEARSAALKEVMSAWTVGDPAAAASWVAATADEKTKQEGTRAVAQVILDQPDMIQEQLLQSIPPETKAEYDKLKAEADAAAAAEPVEENAE